MPADAATRLDPPADAMPLALARSRAASPIVGREDELRRLHSLLAERADGLTLVIGEPGVGKTRLVAELAADLARTGGRVLHGQCDPAPAAPYGPIVEALRDLELDRLASIHRQALARLVPELAARRREPAPAGELDEPERQRLFDTVAAALAELDRGRRSVLLIEDVHWAAPSTLALIADLARRGPGLGALLVATAREPDPDLGEPLPVMLGRLGLRAPVHRVALGGLTEVDVAAAAQAWTGHTPPPGLAARLHGLSGGNPFYLRSAVRQLEAGQGAWSPTPRPVSSSGQRFGR